MLVDRVSCRLDSFTPRRENEYRHPPCTLYSIILKDYLALVERSNREKSREFVKKPHVQIELIEESS
jgi:hypothetical protein